MGSEAIGSVTITDHTGTTVAHAPEVRLLLESRDLILRGALRRTLPFDTLQEVSAEGDRLRFRHAGENYLLVVGSPAAARWASKISTPPPTLAAKLGVSADHPALVIGRVTDARLVDALLDASAGGGAESAGAENEAAVVAVTEVDDAEALDQALEQLPPGMPLWVVHRKGKGALFGDAAVRRRMRELGFVDTKVSAVSDLRTATRYSARDGRTPAPSSVEADAGRRL